MSLNLFGFKRSHVTNKERNQRELSLSSRTRWKLPVAGLKVAWKTVQMSTDNGEPAAGEEAVPWAQSSNFKITLRAQPSLQWKRRDHPRTHSFASSGLLARLLYLNWFVNSVKQMLWLIFFPWINHLFGHLANTGFLCNRIRECQLSLGRHMPTAQSAFWE